MSDNKIITKECEYCKKSFDSFVSQKKKFCCKLCYRMSQVKCKEKKTCPVCNKEFTSHICKNQECCSNKCRHELHKSKLCQKINKNCKVCGKIFEVAPANNKQLFCSLECFHTYTRNKRPRCKVCGAITSHTKSVYCSRDCMAKSYENNLRKEMNPNWKGGKNKRFSSGVPLSLRDRVFARDNNSCKICGVKNWDKNPSLLYVHHIIEVKDGGSNSLDNLETLCFVCHWEGKHGYKLNEYLQQIASQKGCGIR